MRVDIISIFPEYFAPLDLSLIGKARASGVLDLALHDLRTWTSDVHRTVDDTPYGGGPGMVMRPEPWGLALDALLSPAPDLPEGAANSAGLPDGAANPAGLPDGAANPAGLPDGAANPAGLPDGAANPAGLPEGGQTPSGVG